MLIIIELITHQQGRRIDIQKNILFVSALLLVVTLCVIAFDIYIQIKFSFLVIDKEYPTLGQKNSNVNFNITTWLILSMV